jgi:phosphoglucosamine mutase
MRIRFGTDGLRGTANRELTPEVAVALGRAAAMVLAESDWFVGWDTRISSTMLAGAFGAGVASAGRGMTQLGGVPTAGVAFVCRNHGLPGAMVTASHNPYGDNGIKIFGPDGQKLSDDIEGRIEELLHQALGGSLAFDPPAMTGQIHWTAPPAVRAEHRDWLTGRARLIDATGLRIGVDCANGAAYDLAPEVIEATGALVDAVGDQPNGVNINDGCGSTSLDELKRVVTENGLDFGLAFDGDADRLLGVDHHGQTVDGDQIISILARRRSLLGTLHHNGVVVTEWSNLGLLRSLRAEGIAVEVCPVGDKAVAEAMKRTGYVLGGEQSGHIIMSDLLAVGDGISTAIELVGAIVDSGRPLADLCEGAMHKVPQLTQPVSVTLPPRDVVDRLGDEVRSVNAELGERGRLVLRPSGTEYVVRVMAEADDASEVAAIVGRLASLVSAAGGAPIGDR